MTECSQTVDDTSEVISRLEAIYAQLPALGCKRLYGMAEGLACEHGCAPPGGLVPRAEAAQLIREVEALSVAATGVCRGPRG